MTSLTSEMAGKVYHRPLTGPFFSRLDLDADPSCIFDSMKSSIAINQKTSILLKETRREKLFRTK